MIIETLSFEVTFTQQPLVPSILDSIIERLNGMREMTEEEIKEILES